MSKLVPSSQLNLLTSQSQILASETKALLTKIVPVPMILGQSENIYPPQTICQIKIPNYNKCKSVNVVSLAINVENVADYATLFYYETQDRYSLFACLQDCYQDYINIQADEFPA